MSSNFANALLAMAQQAQDFPASWIGYRAEDEVVLSTARLSNLHVEFLASKLFPVGACLGNHSAL